MLDVFLHLQVASAPQQVLSPKRLRPANPLVLTTPVAPPSVVSTLPPVISSHLLNNNYLLASQSQAAAAVANFSHHPLASFHPHQASPVLQNLSLPIAAKSQIASIQINSSSPTATIPTQIPNYIATAQHQQQLQSINTSVAVFNASPVALTTSTSVASATVGSNILNSNTPGTTSPLTPNNNMDQVGQNTMQSHPLSQSMDSVNTASNEEEVSNHSLKPVAQKEVVMFC